MLGEQAEQSGRKQGEVARAACTGEGGQKGPGQARGREERKEREGEKKKGKEEKKMEKKKRRGKIEKGKRKVKMEEKKREEGE